VGVEPAPSVQILAGHIHQAWLFAQALGHALREPQADLIQVGMVHGRRLREGRRQFQRNHDGCPPMAPVADRAPAFTHHPACSYSDRWPSASRP